MPAAFCGGFCNDHRDHHNFLTDSVRQLAFASDRAPARRAPLRFKARASVVKNDR
jgi:hypothetical protein